MKTITVVLAVAANLAIAPGLLYAQQSKPATSPSDAGIDRPKTERASKGRDSARAATAVPVRIEGTGPQSGASNAPLKFNPKGEQKPSQ